MFVIFTMTQFRRVGLLGSAGMSAWVHEVFRLDWTNTLEASNSPVPATEREWATLVVHPQLDDRDRLFPRPPGAHLSVRENLFQVVQVIDDGGPTGRWGGLCGVLGLQNPQGTFELVHYSGEYYVRYMESEGEKKWAEKVDRKYLRMLMRKDPDKFLEEMTPNLIHNGTSVGLDLNHPHHQNLQKEFQKDVRQICKEKGLNDHPALVMDPAVAKKIENANHPISSKVLYVKNVVLREKKNPQKQNDNSPIKSEEPSITI